MDTEIGRGLETVLSEINESIHSTLHSISISTMLMLKNRLEEAKVPKSASSPATDAS